MTTTSSAPPDVPVDSPDPQASSCLDTWCDHPAVTRMSDEAMAAAYESVDARDRSWLKLTIAQRKRRSNGIPLRPLTCAKPVMPGRTS